MITLPQLLGIMLAPISYLTVRTKSIQSGDNSIRRSVRKEKAKRNSFTMSNNPSVHIVIKNYLKALPRRLHLSEEHLLKLHMQLLSKYV